MPNRLIKIYNKFFNFIEISKSTYPLFFFRTGLSIFCLVKIYILHENYLTFFGQYGITQWVISKFSDYLFLPHIGDISIFLSNILAISTNDATILVIHLFYIFCGLMCIGFLTRFSTFVCFYIHLALMNTGGGIMYGVDTFTQIALFYALFFPLGSTYSFDSLIGITKYRSESLSAGISIRMMQIQLCIVYFITAVDKCKGHQWLNGEAMWRSVTLNIWNNHSFYWLANFPLVSLLFGYFVLIIEFGYAFFMWMKGIRVIWLFLIVSLHVGIGIVMGMWCFASIMIFLSLFAFGDDVVNDIKFYCNRKAAKFPPITSV
jgi:hypothetical protein